MMAVSKLIRKLQGLRLASGTQFLTDPSMDDFKEALMRWTDMDKKTPFAIVKPVVEDDVVKIIKLAIESSVPFVCRSGGHSSWSTIGSEGFVLDFTQMRSVKVDVVVQTATASAGTLIGDIVSTVYEKGYSVATGTVNSVGFIPSTIGGGLCALVPLMGHGADNIVSARMITAKGDLITVSEETNSELPYAIKGAGQFFGTVTSLTVKIHPLSVLGTPGNTVWTTTLIFQTTQAVQFAEVLLRLKAMPKNYCMGGVLATPPTFDPVLMVIGLHMGNREDGEKAFKPLLDLGPITTVASGDITYDHINDAFMAFESKGGFKKWLCPGFTESSQFKPEFMSYFADKLAEIIHDYPTARTSAFVIEFTSASEFDKVPSETESAFSHHDVSIFSHLICMASDAKDFAGANNITDEMMTHVRQMQPMENYSFYQNFSREALVEERYRGTERREKLKILKQKWDPSGIFTKELL